MNSDIPYRRLLRALAIIIPAIAGAGCSSPAFVDATALGLTLSGTITRLDDGSTVAGAMIAVRTGRFCDHDFFTSEEFTADSDGAFAKTVVTISGVPECMLVIGTAPGLLPDTLAFSLPPFHVAPDYGELTVALRLRD